MSKLLEQLRAQRDTRLEVEPGKWFVVRRPLAADFYRFISIDAAAAASCVVGWDGLTEADFLGATVGSSDLVPFDAELCAEALADRTEWAKKTAKTVADSIKAYVEARQATAKN